MANHENLAYEGISEKINPRMTEQSKVFRKKIYQTGGNVYTAMGYAIDVPVMIEGNDGIIIIDPCEAHGVMGEIMKDFRKITEKPVKAVVYTHHHPDHWAGVKAVVSQEQVDNGECMIIAQEEFACEVAKMTGILCDIKVGRALYMYGYMLPVGEEGRVNLGLGPCMMKDEQYIIQPTVLVDKELKMNIAGVDLEFYHIPSECKDEICVWMPQNKVLHVAECIQGENYPNLYSIRGANRDPLKWINSIDFMRTLPAEHIVGNHMRPVEGAEEVQEHLRDYRDMIQYTHDQTIRLINKGLTPDNIIKELEKLPPHLYQRPRMGEFYGTFIQGVKLVYSMNVGWFNGDAATLDPLPPSKSGENYTKLIGRERILEESQKAIQEGDYKWAAELVSNLIRDDRQDMEARHIKAEALRNLGYRTENGPFRNWYMTQAMNLDGMFEEVKKAIPEFNGPAPYFEALTRVDPKYIWDCFRVKLNGPKAQDVEMALTINITDSNITNDLEIRKGIVQVHETGSVPTFGVIALSQMDFLQLFTKIKTVKELFDEGNMKTEADLDRVTEFFQYFDGFTPLFDMEYPFE